MKNDTEDILLTLCSVFTNIVKYYIRERDTPPSCIQIELPSDVFRAVLEEMRAQIRWRR